MADLHQPRLYPLGLHAHHDVHKKAGKYHHHFQNEQLDVISPAPLLTGQSASICFVDLHSEHIRGFGHWLSDARFLHNCDIGCHGLVASGAYPAPRSSPGTSLRSRFQVYAMCPRTIRRERSRSWLACGACWLGGGLASRCLLLTCYERMGSC